MNVYQFTLEEGYKGGEVIVAAHSSLEAFGLIAHEKGCGMLLEHLSIERCKQLDDVIYTGALPAILTCEYYIE